MRRVRILVLALMSVIFTGTAQGQGVVVDHSSLTLFDQIPEEYLRAAASMKMMFVDRSVGGFINEGLTCLSHESDEVAPTPCKTYIHIVPEFSSPASEVDWSRPSGYDRSNWRYYGWPGIGIPPELPCGPGTTSGWSRFIECFIDFVDANPAAYEVYSFQLSYLEVLPGSSIASPTDGYFVPQARSFDIADFEALQARHPNRVFVHHTTSLARGIGTQESTDFNDRQRAYVREHAGYLLDVAAIESHDPWGRPCYDNRDGVPYIIDGVVRENHPDDGLALPAICQHYTREVDGGHPTAPDVKKIRLAKAFWVLMARIAGWNPDGQGETPDSPTNLRIIR